MTTGWVPLMPARRRQRRQHRLDPIAQRGRSHGLSENSQALALTGAYGLQGAEESPQKTFPAPRIAMKRYLSRAVGIVQIHQARLGPHVGGPEARRMIRVAFYFRRPAQMALDQNSLRQAVQRDRCGEELRSAGDDLFGRVHVGDDELGGLPRASGKSAQTERSRHE